MTSQGNELDFENQEFIASGATVVLSQSKECNPYSYETNIKASWKIVPPIKTLDVPVTKYRTVEIK